MDTLKTTSKRVIQKKVAVTGCLMDSKFAYNVIKVSKNSQNSSNTVANQTGTFGIIEITEKEKDIKIKEKNYC